MKTIIYFDGACQLCSREMEHYRKIDRNSSFEFVNIAHPSFDARAEGLDPVSVNQEMHVRDENGQLLTAVDAFLEIWKHLPAYRKWIPVAQNRAVRPLLDLGYRMFASARPYLPKRKNCELGACSISSVK